MGSDCISSWSLLIFLLSMFASLSIASSNQCTFGLQGKFKHIYMAQVADKTGLSNLFIFQETILFVWSPMKSASLALKVTVKCCKCNYLRWSVYRIHVNLALMAAGDYALWSLSAFFLRRSQIEAAWKDTFSFPSIPNRLSFPLAFVAGWLHGHWWGFISRNYVVWPTFFLMNVFIALKGSHFWFYI